MSTPPTRRRAYPWDDPRPTVAAMQRLSGPEALQGIGLHIGRRTSCATAIATITDADGRLLAHATTSCQIFRADARQSSHTGQHAARHTGPTA